MSIGHSSVPSMSGCMTRVSGKGIGRIHIRDCAQTSLRPPPIISTLTPLPSDDHASIGHNTIHGFAHQRRVSHHHHHHRKVRVRVSVVSHSHRRFPPQPRFSSIIKRPLILFSKAKQQRDGLGVHRLKPPQLLCDSLDTQTHQRLTVDGQ